MKGTIRSSLLGMFAVLALASGLQGSTITVQNAGFESAILAQNGNGTFSQLIPGSTIFASGGTLDNWVASSSTVGAAAGGFDPGSGNPNWTSTWWSGNNIGYLQVTSGTVALSQTLAATLLNDSTYTLSALVGRRLFTPALNYSIQLWAGSTMLASASNLALAINSSGSDSVTYASGSSNPLAGQTLSIVLRSTYAGGQVTEAFFDNVSLDVVAPVSGVPEPATMGLVVLGIGAGIVRTARRRVRN
jgi:hypothetical protein